MAIRAVQWIGGAMVVAATAVLVGYGACEGLGELFDSDDVPFFIKVAVPALAIGLLILLALVIGQRLQGHRHEHFKEVEN